MIMQYLYQYIYFSFFKNFRKSWIDDITFNACGCGSSCDSKPVSEVNCFRSNELVLAYARDRRLVVVLDVNMFQLVKIFAFCVKFYL